MLTREMMYRSGGCAVSSLFPPPVSATELFAMSWDNYLRMDGNAGDRVTVLDASQWTHAADQTVGTQAYHVWTQSGAQLLIDTDVSTNLV